MSKVHQIITELILKKLEDNIVPWQKPWKGGSNFPKNLVTGKPYRGMNILLLSLSSYDCPYWVTYKQAKQLKGHILESELKNGTIITFWKTNTYKRRVENDTEEPELATSSILRYYRVYNAEYQCEGIESKRLEEWKNRDNHTLDFVPIKKCEEIWDGYKDKPEITSEEQRAYYRPSTDIINMPKMTSFLSTEGYYATLFHEGVHSTGAKNRLNRSTLTKICTHDDSDYSKEELIAEIGSAMLYGLAGIENELINNSVAYIQGWKEKLSNDEKLIISAAGQAQKAVDYILGVDYNYT